MKNRNALTLIEVVAALAILATTATMVLTAYGESLVQLSATRRQTRGHELASELIAHWKINPPQIAPNLEEEFPGMPKWRWRRTVRPYDYAQSLAMLEITLFVFHEQADGEIATVGEYTWLERVPDEQR